MEENIGRFIGDTLELSSRPNHVLRTDNSITRTVTRAVVNWPVICEAIEVGMLDPPEAVAPLPTGEYLAYFASNSGLREANMMPVPKGHAERIRDILPDTRELPIGLRLTEHVTNPRQLETMWGSTFGWDLSGCEAFAERINGNSDIEPTRRNAWFGGVKDRDGRLVATAMAERLNMPSARSEMGFVALAELTEWSVHPSWRGRGLMQALVGGLAKSVKTDLADVPHLAFAECNTTSGADRVAARAGMIVPLAVTAMGEVSQILEGNLRVGDGHEPEGAYRNFTLLTVPETMR